jgi:signal transduction histidine kinase
VPDNALFRTFMDNSPLVAFIADADDRMVYSSEPIPLTPDTVGASMWDLLAPEYVESYRPAMHAARRTGEPQQLTAQAPREGGVGWFQTHYFALPDGAVGGVGLDVTDLVEAEAALRATADELAASRQRIVEAGDAARRRLERDLHDGVQQRLLALLLGLRRVRQRLPADPEGAAGLLDQNVEDLTTAVEELREIAHGIHPTVLTRTGLVAAVRGLAGRFPLPVEVHSSLEARPAAPAEVALYFACSESLTNIAKYAAATSVRISLRAVGREVEVAVSDDGTGLADEHPGGGLEGLRDRLAALGGRLEVRAAPGQGTTVTATAPAVVAVTSAG